VREGALIDRRLESGIRGKARDDSPEAERTAPVAIAGEKSSPSNGVEEIRKSKSSLNLIDKSQRCRYPERRLDILHLINR
jgi:hypothetical protein